MFHIKREKGQGMVEYALIVSLIAIVAIAYLSYVGQKDKETFDKIGGILSNNNIDNAMSEYGGYKFYETDREVAERNKKTVDNFAKEVAKGSQNKYTPPKTPSASKGPNSPPSNRPPVAKFKLDEDIKIPVLTSNKVYFMNLSSDPDQDEIVQEEWKNKLDYYPAGNHIVSLRVADSHGNWSAWYDYDLYIEQGNRNPVANFKFTPTSGITDITEVKFTNTSTDPDGDAITQEEWQNKKSKYAIGSHEVSLRVKDEFGLWSPWVKKTIVVGASNKPPVVTDIKVSPNNVPYFLPNQAITFTPVASDPNGDALTFVWTNKKDKYPTVGMQTISVKAIDSKGAESNTFSIKIEISNVKPGYHSSCQEIKTFSPQQESGNQTLKVGSGTAVVNCQMDGAGGWEYYCNSISMTHATCGPFVNGNNASGGSQTTDNGQSVYYYAATRTVELKRSHNKNDISALRVAVNGHAGDIQIEVSANGVNWYYLTMIDIPTVHQQTTVTLDKNSIPISSFKYIRAQEIDNSAIDGFYISIKN